MANLDNCKFVTLIEGIQKPVSNMYAVVSCVVQEPKITRRNTLHGICILVDPSCYEGSVQREEFCIQYFTPFNSSAPIIECGDVLVLRGITKQQSLRNPEKSEFLLRSDTNNMMLVFPNGKRDLVRVGSGLGPVPKNITQDNLWCIESLSNWHNKICMAPCIMTSVKSPAMSSPVNWSTKLKQQLAELDVYSSRLRLEQQPLASSFLSETATKLRELINSETFPKHCQDDRESESGSSSKKIKRGSIYETQQHFTSL